MDANTAIANTTLDANSTVDSVFTIFQNGDQFDPTLTGNLYNAQTIVGGVSDNLADHSSDLANAGIPEAATALDNYDPNNMMGQLANFLVGSALPDLFNNLDVFQSLAQIIETDGNDLATAFGSLFAARSFSSACSDINTQLPNLASDTTGTVAADISYRVNQLVALPDQIPNIISAEIQYFSNSAQTLTTYSQSLQTLQVFSDFTYKAVIGAVGSDALLNVVKPSDAIPPGPPSPRTPPIVPPPNQNPDPTP